MLLAGYGDMTLISRISCWFPRSGFRPRRPLRYGQINWAVAVTIGVD